MSLGLRLPKLNNPTTSGGGNAGIKFGADVAASGGEAGDWDGAATDERIDNKLTRLRQMLDEILKLFETLAPGMMLLVSHARNEVQHHW